MSKSTSNRKSVRQVFANDEISLVDLIRLFTDRKKYLLISIGVFFVLGILIAITSPIEYESEAKLLSETDGGGGGLAGLAGLAGVSVPSGGGGGSDLSPDMYSEIVSSKPFLLDLMEERFFFQEKGKEMSLYEYFLEERRGHLFSKTFTFLKGIPGRFFAFFEKEKVWDMPRMPNDSTSVAGSAGEVRPVIQSLSHAQLSVMELLEPRIDIEAEGRMIVMKVKMPEPYVSAEMNTLVLNKVVDYVVAYKTDKQRQNLEFIQERKQEAEQKFKESQLRLATFVDSNQGLVTATARTREQQLQAEFDLTFGIYSAMARELEQTKIQLKKETPLFSDFEPVTVPLTKSEPSVPGIIIRYIILGGVFGFLVIFGSIVRSYFKEGKANAEVAVTNELN